MPKKIEIKVDGKSVWTEEGRNLVDVLNAANVFIPQLCYYSQMEKQLGTCRVCACEVDGREVSGCLTKVKDGMEVKINSPELEAHRKLIVEMMFAEGNHICPSCAKSGNCELQHIAYELDVSRTRFSHLFKERMVDFGPDRLVVEQNRCVKCHRCVEEVKTDDGKRVFSFQKRGSETSLGIDRTEAAKLSDNQLKDAVTMCPTGAIMARGLSFNQPMGTRTFDHDLSQDHKEKAAPQKEKREKKTIATTSLAGCFGCHMSMLDIDLGLLDLIEVVSFNKSPLTDIKEFTEICDIGLIEGGCANAENIEVLKEFRKKCKVLVSVGECAIWGGVPAMRNTVPLGECLEEAYLNSVTSDEGEDKVPYHEDLPKLLDKVYGNHELVKIDHHIPGCPPSADVIWKSVANILWDEDQPMLYDEVKFD
jgi:[NiFe] hydrogenase diaphorase moiety small subunit